MLIAVLSKSPPHNGVNPVAFSGMNHRRTEKNSPVFLFKNHQQKDKQNDSCLSQWFSCSLWLPRPLQLSLAVIIKLQLVVNALKATELPGAMEIAVGSTILVQWSCRLKVTLTLVMAAASARQELHPFTWHHFSLNLQAPSTEILCRPAHQMPPILLFWIMIMDMAVFRCRMLTPNMVISSSAPFGIKLRPPPSKLAVLVSNARISVAKEQEEKQCGHSIGRWAIDTACYTLEN